MDGNRRYARQLGMNIEQGHHDGLTKLFEVSKCNFPHHYIQVIEVCHLLGVRVVTVYAFSLQNFRRSAEEIRHLISLAVNSVDEGGAIRDFALRDSCRIRFCGDLNLVSEELRQLLAEVEADTAHFERYLLSYALWLNICCRITLNICMCYGGRSDINSALKKSAICEREGYKFSHVISIQSFALCMNMLYTFWFVCTACSSTCHGILFIFRIQAKFLMDAYLLVSLLCVSCCISITKHYPLHYFHLAAGDAPPPQVLIRTSGVTRLSDFLIYQCSEYTTFYFYKETWPNICMWSVVGAFIHKTLFDSYNRSTRSFTFFPAER
ncbi:hypothetical protein, conserved [Babesia bigemina]|uniref:Alkyl transferase n=1 Tax=Babesia bigemina TaxID=5866 RepID=A0A061DBM7_BABBI|nr:hypothetical protein, conserved [Babesia bigemina]CDR97963.1 hypothetical protein, conserved [Babesia bigemina]|eukprot:XP_012770149.1 hypothetical protein, conserved [Babesia bigemina]